MHTLPLFQFSKSISRNMDEFAASLTQVYPGVRFETLRSANPSAEACFCYAEIASCSIASIHFGQDVVMRFEPASESRVIAVITQGKGSHRWSFERHYHAEAVQILAQNCTLDMRIAADNSQLVISLPVSGDLEALCQRLFWNASLDTLLSRRIQYLTVDLVRQLHFAASHERSIRHLQDFFAELTDLLLNQQRLLDFENVETFDTTSVRFKHFLNAIEFMHNNPLWAFDIVALAKMSHLSERSLFSWFKHYTGVTPYQYYSTLHLSKVRAELLRSRPQEVAISEIALKHGFYHLSRFARKYRQLFDELPSETLRKL